MSKYFYVTHWQQKLLTFLILYLYTFSLYENASLIIFSAETIVNNSTNILVNKRKIPLTSNHIILKIPQHLHPDGVRSWHGTCTNKWQWLCLSMGSQSPTDNYVKWSVIIWLWVSEWLLFNATLTIVQLYHGGTWFSKLCYFLTLKKRTYINACS